jgi:hypothetical protein
VTPTENRARGRADARLADVGDARVENAARAIDEERWLRVVDVAAMFDVSVDYVYAHWRELGGRKLGASRNAPVRFRLEDVLAATSAGDSLPVTQEVSRSTKRRSRNGSGTSVPLLPIRGGRTA